MPIIYDKTTSHCPVQTGLTSARIRIIIDPHFTDRSLLLATHVIEQITDLTIQNLAVRILSDPPNWTVRMAQTSSFGLQLGQHSLSQLFITDITCTHTLQMPKTILVTIELGSIFGV